MSKQKSKVKSNLHPRNIHRNGYNFEFLVEKYPSLEGHLFVNEYDTITLDFSVPSSIRALNAALLSAHYDISRWDIPNGYLCPPVPGRADHLHYIADLIGSSENDTTKKRILDIGTGANVIYPLLGNKIYGWEFLASEVDSRAYKAARQIVELNGLKKKIQVVFQKDANKIFFGVVRREETFDACICNPPFHGSQEEAERGSKRKWKNLGKNIKKSELQNFGGQNTELSYPGGEVEFIKNMIHESRKLPHLCKWFTTLVSKQSSLKPLEKSLASARVKELKVIPMGQGQKVSRILAWRY
ncbi:MAG: 23S rRNA (adenine(1618)-N(6))-methyltransferase RlmF [Saprospiraceae bacterium]|nr:23S rRNA (adenine(1618)-N(6))-methyltransferase RlmF [Saprospiraceae bacterium]